MGYSVNNDVDIRIKTNLFKELLRLKNMRKRDFLEYLIMKNSLDIGYKTINAMMRQQNPWKLLYAFLICEELDVEVEDLFELYEK